MAAWIFDPCARRRRHPFFGEARSSLKPGLAQHWWALGLRGVAGLAFAVGILTLPSATLASLVLLFALYVAADGALAILIGIRSARRGERWRMLVIEGATNIIAASAAFAWPAIALVPFLRLVSAWAIVTGALLLAAAHRLSRPQGRWALALGGGISAGWGVLVATLGPDAASEPRALGLWLAAYAVVFGATLFALGHQLSGQRETRSPAPASGHMP
jgi:uncharacterized membrane protein HdeD (DUF308 family)